MKKYQSNRHYKKHLLILVTILTVVFFYMFLNKSSQINSVEVKTINDLVFKPKSKNDFRIFLPENNQLEPYYVATNNFSNQGSVLLIREYVWDEPMMQQENRETTYYATSIPDKFLNKEFIKRFPEELQIKIPFTKVVIRDNEFRSGSNSYEKISRQLFLFNGPEWSDYLIPMWDEQGLEIFNFFDKNDFPYRKARLIDEMEGKVWKRAVGWWARSDKTGERILTDVFTHDGKISLTDLQSFAYVRPAFCLPPTLPVKQIELLGEKIYVLEDYEFETINEKVFIEDEE